MSLYVSSERRGGWGAFSSQSTNIVRGKSETRLRRVSFKDYELLMKYEGAVGRAERRAMMTRMMRIC